MLSNSLCKSKCQAQCSIKNKFTALSLSLSLHPPLPSHFCISKYFYMTSKSHKSLSNRMACIPSKMPLNNQLNGTKERRQAATASQEEERGRLKAFRSGLNLATLHSNAHWSGDDFIWSHFTPSLTTMRDRSTKSMRQNLGFWSESSGAWISGAGKGQ